MINIYVLFGVAISLTLLLAFCIFLVLRASEGLQNSTKLVLDTHESLMDLWREITAREVHVSEKLQETLDILEKWRDDQSKIY